MAKNFLITGHGRSGTAFLARTMNRSKVFNVMHEPRPRILAVNWRRVVRRFVRNYGEVNSLLRKVALSIPVSLRGVVLRNPRDITLSFFNKSLRDRIAYENKLAAFVEGFEDVDCLVRAGTPVIWFEKMTTDRAYLQQVLQLFGIHDVKVTDKMIDMPVNALKDSERQVTEFDRLPSLLKSTYAKHIQTFEDNFYGVPRSPRVVDLVPGPSV